MLGPIEGQCKLAHISSHDALADRMYGRDMKTVKWLFTFVCVVANGANQMWEPLCLSSWHSRVRLDFSKYFLIVIMLILSPEFPVVSHRRIDESSRHGIIWSPSNHLISAAQKKWENCTTHNRQPWLLFNHTSPTGVKISRHTRKFTTFSLVRPRYVDDIRHLPFTFNSIRDEAMVNS